MTSILRQLSAIFVMAATTFAVMAALAQHPDWARTARETSAPAVAALTTAWAETNKTVIQPGFAFAKEQGDTFVKWANAQMSPVQVAKKQTPTRAPVQVAKKPAAQPAPQVAKSEPAPVEKIEAPVVVAKTAPVIEETKPVVVANNTPAPRPTIVEEKPAEKPAIVAMARPKLELVPPPEADIRPMVSRAGPGPGELIRVAERLKSNLSPDLLNSFELFLYVSKADTGSWSQRMYVFAKQGGGNLDLLYNWPASTGREAWELDVHGKKQNSFTPQGYYELDPQRMHAKYHSGQWNQPMPYAMFFNWEQNGYQTGLAIHGAHGNDVALLGQRASAGCVRLAPENARMLFNLIRGQYKGLAPKFAYNKRTATMDNNGLLLHDKNGKIVFSDGFKVLVFIENYGGNDMVAALF